MYALHVNHIASGLLHDVYGFFLCQVDGLRANVVTYNTLIDIYGKLGRWVDAIGVLDMIAHQVTYFFILTRTPTHTLCTKIFLAAALNVMNLLFHLSLFAQSHRQGSETSAICYF